MEPRYINQAIRDAVKIAHPKRFKEWKTKNLRDAYNDCLLRAEIQREVKDSMMGHKRQGARGNYEVSPTTIKEAYTKAFRYLSVNHGTQSKQDYQRIEQSVLGLTTVIDNLKQRLEQQEAKITKYIEYLEAFIKGFTNKEITAENFVIMMDKYIKESVKTKGA